MKTRLKRLGERHTLFRGFGFTPYHWDLFHKSTLVTIGFCFREHPKHFELLVSSSILGKILLNWSKLNFQSAWDKLIRYIIDHMQDGYDETLQSQNQFDYGKKRIGSKSTSVDTCLDDNSEEVKTSDFPLDSSVTPVTGRRWRFRNGSLPMYSCTHVQQLLSDFRTCSSSGTTTRRRHFSNDLSRAAADRNRNGSGETSNGYFSKGSSSADFLDSWS